MSRYINADKLKSFIDAGKHRNPCEKVFSENDIIDMVDKMPSADVAEVKHGKWQEEYKEDAPILFKRRWVCSVCGDYQRYGATEYCPMCGADMRERKTE